MTGDSATARPATPGTTTPSPRRRRRARWLVPAGLATVALGAALLGPVVATAAPALPPRTAGELLASLGAADRVPLSGTVVETARLGLPALPAPDGSISPAMLLTGSHTARVWYSGDDKFRIALVGNLAETDLIRNGEDAWLWTSGANTAQHLRIPANADARATRVEESIAPQAAAAQALAAIDPTTEVSVDGTARVAGRAAYELVLRPRDERTLVGQVRLAVDSATSVPLRVQVYARDGGAPAFETGFTSVSFDRPDPAVFRFAPPRGAKVTEVTPDRAARQPSSTGGRDAKGKDAKGKDAKGRAGMPVVTGSGWTSVVQLDGVRLPGSAGSSGTSGSTGSTSTAPAPELGALLRAATPVRGAYGSGRLLRTKLVSALLLDDGRLFVGAVRPDVLEAAASR